ncbi:formate dehydrogenase subunit delta [Novosphingobium aquae]|uniref:Formate dehydrogenase subunit delta n=1 Tax=Novosphingobium aquae TaxID=3133435 RepID=A0ABU8S361_9SPHN
MANQIVRNFAALGEDHAAEATAEHIKDYWDPRMRAALRLPETKSALDPIARRAAELLHN